MDQILLQDQTPGVGAPDTNQPALPTVAPPGALPGGPSDTPGGDAPVGEPGQTPPEGPLAPGSEPVNEPGSEPTPVPGGTEPTEAPIPGGEEPQTPTPGQ